MDKEKSMSTRCVIYTALAIFLAGCVPSLHELYTEDTVVFDPKLVGCWQAEALSGVLPGMKTKTPTI